MSSRSRLARLLLVSALSAGVAHAQLSAPKWEVGASAALDLWYYGMASVGIEGPGSFSYYDNDFVRLMNQERGGAIDRVFGSREEHDRIGKAFRSDTVFEALHFLPLYYSNDDGLRVISVLRSLESSSNPLFSVFSRPAQRLVLRDFANALDKVRKSVRESPLRAAAIDDRTVATFDDRWNGQFVPALITYLRAIGISHGVLLISPVVGKEGRIIQSGDGTVIVAGLGHTRNAPLHSAVRELCFPLVEKTAGLIPASGSRLDAVEATSRAATQCGAMLLERVMSGEVDEYRRLYLGGRASQASVASAFNAAFPLSQLQGQVLRAEIERAVSISRNALR